MSTPTDDDHHSASVTELLTELKNAELADHPQLFSAIHEHLVAQLQHEAGEEWDA